MKIIRLTTSLDFGGQEKQYISFTEQPEMLKHHYIFGAIGHGGYAENFLINKGFTVQVFNRNPRFTQLKNIFILYKWFKRVKPDIVHTAASEANFHGVIAAWLAGIKIILAEEIGFPNHSKRAQFLYKIIYRKTKGVICVSKAVRDRIVEIGEITKSQAIVIYNPVSTPEVVPKSFSAKFRMVYVGRLEANKNVSFLINVLKNWKDSSELQLIVVGDGSQREYLEQLVKRNQLEDLIEFIGFSEKPEKYVSQADLFILPSKSEGFGIAVVEAMYQGIPCLCSNVGGIPEFIQEGKTGWLFDPNKEESLRNQLNKILDLEQEDLIKIGQAGRNYVLLRFRTSLYVEKIEKIYTELAQ